MFSMNGVVFVSSIVTKYFKQCSFQCLDLQNNRSPECIRYYYRDQNKSFGRGARHAEGGC